MNTLYNVRHIGGLLTLDDRHETNSIDGEELSIRDMRANSFDVPLYSFCNRGTWSIYSPHSLSVSSDIMDCLPNSVEIESSNDGTIYKDYEVNAYSDWMSWQCDMKLHPNGDNAYVTDRIIAIINPSDDTVQHFDLLVSSAEGSRYMFSPSANPDLGFGYPEGEFILRVRRTFSANLPFGTIRSITPSEEGKPVQLFTEWLKDCAPASRYLNNIGYYFMVDVSEINLTTVKTSMSIHIDTNDLVSCYTTNDSLLVNGRVHTNSTTTNTVQSTIKVSKNPSINGSLLTDGTLYLVFSNCGVYPIPYTFINESLAIYFHGIYFDENNDCVLSSNRAITFNFTMLHMETTWRINKSSAISMSQVEGAPTGSNTTFDVTASISANNTNTPRTLTIDIVTPQQTFTYTIHQPSPQP